MGTGSSGTGNKFLTGNRIGSKQLAGLYKNYNPPGILFAQSD
jgi:hypothetical protein